MTTRDRLYHAILFIEENLSAYITIEDICHSACYSKYHFQRLFHAATGVTLAEYILTRRITESARLLQQSRDSVLQIALTYQFKSHQHFSRAFKQLFGLTPSQFRKTGVAVAPKLFEPFTRDDIDVDLDKSGIFLTISMHHEEAVYIKEAPDTTPDTIHQLWGQMRALFPEEQEKLKGMIFYPEHISFDLPYEYAIVSPSPAKGLKKMLLPATEFAEFRYVGSIENLSNMYRYIYCVWMDREGYNNPFNFDLEQPTANFRGPSYDNNEMIIQVPVAKV